MYPINQLAKPKTFEQWAAEHRWEPSPHYVGVPRYDGPGELDSIPTQAAHRVWDDAREGLVPADAVKQPQWVSVKERLPDKCVKVLVHGRSYSAAVLGWVDNFDRWMVEDSNMLIYDPSVTHWMPLPEPPAPEQDDGFEAWWEDTREVCMRQETMKKAAEMVWQAAQKAKEGK